MKSLFLTASLLLLLAGCSSSIQTATQYYQFEQPIGASSRNVADTDAQLRIQTVVLRGALNNLGIIKGLPVITELDQQTFYELEYEIHHFNGDMQGNADISGLWRLYYTHPETGRRLISINNFSQLVPIDDDGYDGLVSTLEATWLNINLNVAKQIEQARL